MLNALLAALLLPFPSVSPRAVVYGLARDLSLTSVNYGRCEDAAALARAQIDGKYNYLTTLSYTVDGELNLIQGAVNRRAARAALRAVGAWQDDALARWREFALVATPRTLYQIVLAPRQGGADVCFNLYIRR